MHHCSRLSDRQPVMSKQKQLVLYTPILLDCCVCTHPNSQRLRLTLDSLDILLLTCNGFAAAVCDTRVEYNTFSRLAICVQMVGD